MKNEKINYYENRERGFSLVEVLIASFIVAIILGLASTSFLNLAPKYKLNSAVREINSRLNYARYKSIFEGVKVRVKFNQHSYAIETYDEEKNEWKREREYFLNGVTLKANNSPVFHPVGTVSNLASIYISNSWGKHKITLAISGRIKIIQL
jgi:prepilin-type N-terminal cleavage/methylation domain-containing protein